MQLWKKEEDFMRDRVEEFIDFIISVVNDEFDYKLDFIDSRYYFINGGCLMFARVLKHYLPEAQIVMNRKLDHIAILYYNEFYDATGKVENDSFQEVTLEYLECYQKYYGRPEIEISKKFTDQIIIQELDSCSGEPVLRLLQNIQNNKVLCKTKFKESNEGGE